MNHDRVFTSIYDYEADILSEGLCVYVYTYAWMRVLQTMIHDKVFTSICDQEAKP